MNPNFTSQSQTQALENQAYQHGQARTQAINNQSAQDQAQYAQDVAQKNQSYNLSNSAYNNLLNYTNNLPNTYFSNLNRSETNQGYNPNVTSGAESALLPAVQSASTSAEAYANAPRAAQQMSNYSGATAGQETQNLSNLSSRLSGAQAYNNAQLTGLQGVIGAQQGLYGQDVTNANNITGQQSTNYGNLLTGANGQYAQSVSAMQAAGQTMASIMQTASRQGYYNAQQIAQLQNAHNNYVTAQAQALQASVAQQVAPSTIAAIISRYLYGFG